MIRVLSDVFDERRIVFDAARDAQSYLVLAGNVPLGLLASLVPRFLGVFAVTGPADYLLGGGGGGGGGGDGGEQQTTAARLSETDAAWAEECAKLHRADRPVVFLQKGVWRLSTPLAGDLRILGCTLWSPVTRADAEKTTLLDPAWIRAVHADHAAWLRANLSPEYARERQQQRRRRLPAAAADDEQQQQKTFDLPAGIDPLRVASAVAAGVAAFGDTLVITHHSPTQRQQQQQEEEEQEEQEQEPFSAHYAGLFAHWPEDGYPHTWMCGGSHPGMATTVLENGTAVVCPCDGGITYIIRGGLVRGGLAPPP